MFSQHKAFWFAFRQALLLLVDAIERELPEEYAMTTAQIRTWYKKSKKVV